MRCIFVELPFSKSYNAGYMDQHEPLLLNIAAGIRETLGPLLGVLIGAYIANRNQRKRWVADNKKEEYRELMTALSHAFSAVLDERQPMVALDGEEQRRVSRAKGQLPITIADRVFIADEVKGLRVLERWMKAVGDYHSSGDEKSFTLAFVQITDDLTRSAKKVMN